MKESDFTNEQIKDGIKKLRSSLGYDSKDISKGRIKCKDAKFFPNVPSFWKESHISLYHVISDGADDYIKVYDYNGLHVVCSVLIYDGNEWLHVSFSRKSRIPTYDDIQLVRTSFIGEDKKSIMVFPSKEHYVNISKYCLHLWYSPDFELPVFDVEIEGIGRSI